MLGTCKKNGHANPVDLVFKLLEGAGIVVTEKNKECCK